MRIHLRDQLLSDFLKDDYGLHHNVQSSTLMTAELFDISISRIAIKEARRRHAQTPFDLSRRVRVLNHSKYAYAANMSDEDITWANLAYKVIMDDHGQIIGDFVDYLRSSVNLDSDWLYECDGFGRQKKLIIFGTFYQLQREHDKHFAALYDERMAQEKIRIEQLGNQLTEADQVVVDEAAGYQLIQLLTPAALDHEGAFLQHCIGHGTYDYALNTDNERLYSIRNDGKRLATMHVKDSEYGAVVIQYRGFRNSRPESTFFEVFENRMGWITMGRYLSLCESKSPTSRGDHVGF